jgi:hypothetical protein
VPLLSQHDRHDSPQARSSVHSLCIPRLSLLPQGVPLSRSLNAAHHHLTSCCVRRDLFSLRALLFRVLGERPGFLACRYCSGTPPRGRSVACQRHATALFSSGPGGVVGQPYCHLPWACGGCCPTTTCSRPHSTVPGLPPNIQPTSPGLYDSTSSRTGCSGTCAGTSSGAACTTASRRAACTPTARAACFVAGHVDPCTTGLSDGHPVTDWNSSPGPALRLLRHSLCRLASTGELQERLGRPSVEGCHGRGIQGAR